jgi:hypothetical protein
MFWHGASSLVREDARRRAEAHQRTLRDGGNLADVQRRFHRASLPRASRRLYEWRDDPDGKTPFAVARVDGEPLAFAGIWEEWRSPNGERLQTFSTIITAANGLLAAIQPRMPVNRRASGLAALAWRGRGRHRRAAPSGARGRAAAVAGRQAGGQRPNDGPELLKRVKVPEPAEPMVL